MRESLSFETADGTRLSVDAAGDGVPVVFQHGLCGDANQTAETFPPDIGFRRITVEARAHGRSQAGPPERLSIATFAADIARYVETALVGPVVIGGISMGAAVALRLAVTRPDLVRALILARPAWVTASAPDNMAPNAEVGRFLEILPPQEAKAAFLDGATGRRLAADAPDNLASLTGFFARTPLDVTATLLRAISVDGPGVSDDSLARIAVPTLVIGHAHDVIHPLAHAHALAERIAGARFVEITPKAESRSLYVADFRHAVATFLKEH